MCFRSPLNIVHAGLDIIRSEMKAIENSSSVVLSSETAEMIEQIFSASETAINILDDLLNYEHMDSGRFTPTYRKNDQSFRYCCD